ncbi:TPA: fimbrial biogenesis usher protein [Escherichia coli]|nr:fimbrial biogenesis usher protein [Escherichia coli]HAX0905676.1 fimbrial biogenesis usher protein [Escherichia coli]
MYRTHRQHSLLSSGGVPSFIGGLVVFVSASFNAQAETWFDPAFFKDDPSMVADLSRFEKGQKITPGVYRVDIVLNQTIVDMRNVNFVEITPEKGIAACLTTESLDAMGVNTDAFPAFKQLDKQACAPLAEIIPDASVTFNVNKLRLEISVPQIAIKSNARGYVPPERWDEGINALLLGYSFSGANSIHSSADSDSGDSYFLNLNSGVNLGPWRLRNNSTWSRSSGQTAEWKNLSSYLQRVVIPLKGELTVGDDYTAGDFFDSVSFRGVQLASDDNMLPDSLKGFAPVVRGIAKSNAQITIKQNGYTIYQTYVSPGAFEISDLYSTSSSGDLLVEIKEADGSVNSYSVPFSSVPLLQRQGRIKYAVTLAKYRTNSNEQQESKFAQATLQWGGPWGTTWYGGGQYAEYYRAAMFGLGFNLGDFGAISFDVTQAKSTLADQSEHKGQSYRFLYAKTLNQLGTNFQLMGYRYSTSGFYTLSDTMYKHMDGYEFNDGDDEDTPMWSRYYNLFYTKRGKLQVNISQQLGEYGSFYLSGSQQTYWHTDQQDRLLQFGYNTQIKDLSLGVSWNYSKSRGQPDADQVFALNFSLPINLLLPRSNDSYTSKKNYAWMTSNTSIDNEGHTTQNLGLTETLLDDGNLSYSVQQGYNSEGKTANGSASMDYKGAFADARVGYNYSDNGSQQQLNYALSGSLVAHSQGITLGQSLGETNVLIAAPGAENTRVANSTGLKTDWRGYTVVPYATSYRENRIALDAASLKRNVDLENAVVNVVPTKGALVLAEFNAHAGARVLMKTTKQGIPLRFGAIATLDGVQANSGIIDDDGSLYMAGLPAKGTITVRWGEAPDQICHISYELTEQQINSAITRMDAICR